MPPEAEQRPVVLVTGVAGNLGARLLHQFGRFDVIGVDMSEDTPPGLLAYERLDLAEESSCAALVALLKRWNCSAVVHLAFVIDPVRSGVLQTDRMWQINVAGTARVMEAITEVNRRGGNVQQFIFPSSVSAYGPETDGPVKEEAPLLAHTLPYAVHKKEADLVVQERAETLGGCHTFILRPHICRCDDAELPRRRSPRNAYRTQPLCCAPAAARNPATDDRTFRRPLSAKPLPIRSCG